MEIVFHPSYSNTTSTMPFCMEDRDSTDAQQAFHWVLPLPVILMVQHSTERSILECEGNVNSPACFLPPTHKLTPSTGLTTQLRYSYYSYAYFTSQVNKSPIFLALHSCSCISTAGMSVPNHTSSDSVAAPWTDLPKTVDNKTKEPPCTVKPPESCWNHMVQTPWPL